jgi:hypothetical protein
MLSVLLPVEKSMPEEREISRNTGIFIVIQTMPGGKHGKF